MRFSISPNHITKTSNRNLVIISMGKEGWQELIAIEPLKTKVLKRVKLLDASEKLITELSTENTNYNWLLLIKIKNSNFSTEEYRKLGAEILKKIPSTLKRIDLQIMSSKGWQEALPILEGMSIGDYDPKELGYKSKKTAKELEVILHLGTNKKSEKMLAESLIQKLSRKMNAVKETRKLVDMPSNDLGPSEVVNYANEVFQNTSIIISGYDESWLRKKGFNLHLAVGQGSARAPKLLHLKWGKGDESVAIIGKGITFDSGGLSIKHPNKYMMDMKIDMAGGGAVLGLFNYLSGLEESSKVQLHGLIPLADNMPDGKSIKPGDVVKGYGGKTVEILNTDAEGRLVLADSISFAIKDLKSKKVLTLATLTGACMVALGPYTAGWFANNEKWAKIINNAIKKSKESYWRLPLLDNLRSSLNSSLADIKNIGGNYGGAITAALFLEFFAEKVAFAHMDIAGPASFSNRHGPYGAGATGFGVLTLIELLEALF